MRGNTKNLGLDKVLIYNEFFGIEAFSYAKNEFSEFFFKIIYQEKDRHFFAFATHEEKIFFEELLTVTGIGPKTAFILMKQKHYKSIIEAIEIGDKSFFKGITGLGKKTLDYLFLEIKKKSPMMTEKERELLEICQNLGLSKDKIYPLMKTLDFSLPLDSLVKNVCNEFQ
jgi:Holliday junction DNA helicase RuvA